MVRSLQTLILFVFLLAACKKDNAPDPRKELNNKVVETKAPVLQPVYKTVNGAIPAYWLALPALYDSTSKSYPLLLSLHGAGQYGNGSPSQLEFVLIDGVPRILKDGNFPASFTVNGESLSFVIMAPQFTRYPANVEIQSLITYAKKNMRIDPSRIYLTGLSMGSAVSWDAGAEYAAQVAAIVPMSGIPKEVDDLKAKKIAQSGLPVWAFQNDDDATVSSADVKNFVSRINGFSPLVPVKLTVWPSGGHNSWNRAADPNYKENNMNIYEWMLQYKK